jgi:23S rRNA (pseudouridine1915-N3)-methyltransferase
MQLTLAHVGTRSSSKDGFDALTNVYLDRCAILAKSAAASFKTEAALLEWLDRRPGSPPTGPGRWGGKQGRTPAIPVLLDSRGRQLTSEAFAAWLGARRDEGAQHIVFAIGPADGWSEPARTRARLLLSLGTFTLAHALARLVMAEQLYRACTILTGHPYHSGH